MFNHVVAKLPPDLVAAVRDIPLALPLNEPYTTLKTRLVSSFAPSKWEQVSRLLPFPDLGDRRPTALMDAMLASLPTGAFSNCELFQGIFLERMPDYIRLHLSLPIFETAHKMTIMADALWAGHVKSSSGGLPVSAMFPFQNNRSPDHRPSSPTAVINCSPARQGCLLFAGVYSLAGMLPPATHLALGRETPTAPAEISHVDQRPSDFFTRHAQRAIVSG